MRKRTKDYHGSENGYRNVGCRCQPCRDAHARYQREKVAKRMAERIEIDGRLVHPRAEHGRPTSYYNYRCQCRDCTDAAAEQVRNRKKSK